MSSFRTPTQNGMRERTTTRATASERREATDQQLQQQAADMLEAEKITSLDDLHRKLGREKLPSGFTIVKMWLPNKVDVVLTIRLEELDEVLGLPIIRKNLTIYGDMRFRMHVASTEMPLRYAAGLTAEPGIFHSAAEVLNVMARLKSMPPDNMDLKSAAAELLDRAVDADGADELNVCQFAAEQLRLASVPPNRRRYSQALMSLAVVWDRTSPKLYEDLCHSGVVVLPHKTTLRRLTSALSVREGLEIGTVTYLKMRVAGLNQERTTGKPRHGRGSHSPCGGASRRTSSWRQQEWCHEHHFLHTDLVSGRQLRGHRHHVSRPQHHHRSHPRDILQGGQDPDGDRLHHRVLHN